MLNIMDYKTISHQFLEKELISKNLFCTQNNEGRSQKCQSRTNLVDLIFTRFLLLVASPIYTLLVVKSTSVPKLGGGGSANFVNA